MFVQKLATPPAGCERDTRGIHTGDRDKPSTPRGTQRSDKAAFSAESKPEGGVLHVAPNDQTAVVDHGGGPDAQARVRGVRAGRDPHRRAPKALPVDNARRRQGSAAARLDHMDASP